MTRSQKVVLAVLAAAVAMAAAVAFLLLRGPGEVAAPGTPAPAERTYQSDLPAPAPLDNATAAAPDNATASAEPAGPPPLVEDAVVKLGFVTDLAQTLAEAYHPAGTRHNPSAKPLIATSFRKLNMRYGTEFTGLAHENPDPDKTRPALFDYLMNPIVLRALADLYAEPFIQALAEAGRSSEREFGSEAKGYETRPLGPDQVAEVLRLYARQARDLGACFRVFAERRDLTTAVARLVEASQRVNTAYAAYKEMEADRAPRQAMDAQGEEIKRSIAERERLRQGLLAGVAPQGGAAKSFTLTEGDVLDVAGWVYRRLRANPDRINAVGALAQLLPELAAGLEAAADNPPVSPAPAADPAQVQAPPPAD
ncbi:MAG: hypothetical protein AB1916_07400 [Thermodesulfobacteriota bacterium]